MPTSIPQIQVELSEREQEQVATHVRPRAQVLHEAIRLEGEHELERRVSALAWSGFAAGLSMGFSFVAMGLVQAALPEASWRPLIVNFGYAVGFLIVVLARQQLFTENTLTPIIPLLSHRNARTLFKVLRLWAIVLSSNLLGTMLFALVIQRTALFPPDVKAAFDVIGAHALEGGFFVHLLRAIFAGWLIALMVWMTSAGQSRTFVVVLTTYLIGVGGMAHVIVGSVEVFHQVFAGHASMRDYLVGFLVPVLVGNVIGGTTLVGALNHAQVAADPPTITAPKRLKKWPFHA